MKDVGGLRWMENGQSVLSGDLLDAFFRIDEMFLRWSKRVGAEMHAFPTFLPVHELRKLDYFRSFPHIVNFVTNLEDTDANLKSFTQSEVYNDDGSLNLTKITPVHDCLTPAACYHFYVQMQRNQLREDFYGTTRSFCYRREKFYEPLRRQWCFNMREIVCIGKMETVQRFLKDYQILVMAFFKDIGLPIQYDVATDPFFDPGTNPKAVMQILDPVKQEMVFQKDLSLGSFNFHKNYFGQAFDINYEEDVAFSGCVAFGLERWLFAFIETFGVDPKKWPDLTGYK